MWLCLKVAEESSVVDNYSHSILCGILMPTTAEFNSLTKLYSLCNNEGIRRHRRVLFE